VFTLLKEKRFSLSLSCSLAVSLFFQPDVASLLRRITKIGAVSSSTFPSLRFRTFATSSAGAKVNEFSLRASERKGTPIACGAAMSARARARANIRAYSRSRNCYRTAPRGLGLFSVLGVDELVSLSLSLSLSLPLSLSPSLSLSLSLSDERDAGTVDDLVEFASRRARESRSVSETLARATSIRSLSALRSPHHGVQGGVGKETITPERLIRETRIRRDRSSLKPLSLSLSFPHLALSRRRRIFTVTLCARECWATPNRACWIYVTVSDRRKERRRKKRASSRGNPPGHSRLRSNAQLSIQSASGRVSRTAM